MFFFAKRNPFSRTGKNEKSFLPSRHQPPVNQQNSKNQTETVALRLPSCLPAFSHKKNIPSKQLLHRLVKTLFPLFFSARRTFEKQFPEAWPPSTNLSHFSLWCSNKTTMAGILNPVPDFLGMVKQNHNDGVWVEQKSPQRSVRNLRLLSLG